MAVESDTFIRDILFFIKNDFLSNITDPISSDRDNNSKFVMTSYPQRLVQYPIITIKLSNYTAKSSGMQTTTMDVVAFIEIRIWARNSKERDELANDCYKRLRDIQFTASTGSVANYLYDFTLLSSVNVDEEGDDQPKSRILNIQYKFFNA
jgi:Holliday junction resolvasome RuvABC ATP-dependent DNA helicase subunit